MARKKRFTARGLPCLHSLPQYLSVKNQVYQFAALEVGQRVLLGVHTIPILPLPCPLDCWDDQQHRRIIQQYNCCHVDGTRDVT